MACKTLEKKTIHVVEMVESSGTNNCSSTLQVEGLGWALLCGFACLLGSEERKSRRKRVETGELRREASRGSCLLPHLQEQILLMDMDCDQSLLSRESQQ